MKYFLSVFFIVIFVSGCATTETVETQVAEQQTVEKTEQKETKKSKKKKRVCPGSSTGSRLGRRC